MNVCIWSILGGRWRGAVLYFGWRSHTIYWFDPVSGVLPVKPWDSPLQTEASLYPDHPVKWTLKSPQWALYSGFCWMIFCLTEDCGFHNVEHSFFFSFRKGQLSEWTIWPLKIANKIIFLIQLYFYMPWEIYVAKPNHDVLL